jgi:hypothetical protein
MNTIDDLILDAKKIGTHFLIDKSVYREYKGNCYFIFQEFDENYTEFLYLINREKKDDQ